MLDVMVPFYTVGWKNKKKPKSDYDNMITYQNELAGLITDALHRYKWYGLPEETSSRVLEMNALFRGWFGIGDVDGAKLALMFSPDGRLNVNGDPAGAYGYGFNGFNKHFDLYIDGANYDATRKTAGGYDFSYKPDAVVERANDLNYPEIFVLTKAAERISDIQRSLDVISRNLKNPVIIQCDDRQVTEIQRILNARDDNAYTIIGVGALPFDSFRTWETGQNPATIAELWRYRENIINEAREKLGILNNPLYDKRERLLTDEINANNQQTYINLDKGLERRKRFCEKVNALWGLNISVSVDNELGNNDIDDELEVEEYEDENDSSESGK